MKEATMKTIVKILIACYLVFDLTVGIRAEPAASAPQTVRLTVQRRGDDDRAIRETIDVDPAKTAVVIIDMWDRHWCKTYTARVGNLVPRMNRTLEAVRKLGIQIVHLPSDVVEFYRDYPQRKAMQAIPQHPVPKPVEFNPPPPPGPTDCCECGPEQPCRAKSFGRWSRQHPDLRIAEGDLIGDCNNGRELLNLVQQRNIDTLLYMGVASNMCVQYRSCGIRNMKRHGLRAIVVADLVEAITANGLGPDRQPDPNFTPAKGSARIQRHLERHVAPTIESRQLIAAAGMDPHADDKRPQIVFVIAEHEYKTRETLPAFAEEHLAKQFRCTFVFAKGHRGEDRHDVPGLEALYDADLLVLSMRRRALPVVQMDHLERYLRSGKPIVAIRLSIVPFQVGQAPPGHVSWPAFDREVLGCHYQGYAAESRQTGCDVWVADGAKQHPILRGIDPAGFHSSSWMYRLRPLAESTTLLIEGRWGENQPVEPVAFTNTYQGARVFYTALGHPGDFKIPQFKRLMVNAIRWALEKPGTPGLEGAAVDNQGRELPGAARGWHEQPGKAAADRSPPADPKAVIKRAADAVLRDFPQPPPLNWGEGVMLTGMMRAYRLTGDPRYLKFVRDFGDYHQRHGIGPTLAKRGYCGHWGPGFPLLMLYETTKDKRYLELVEEINQFMLQRAERSEEGGLSHFSGKVQLWVDTLDMCCPVLSHSARITNRPELQREAVRQLLVFAKHLQDPNSGMFYHMWDQQSGRRTTEFWGRGNGWVVMSYTEVLKNEKPGSPTRARLAKAFQKQLAGIVPLQDAKTGLWHTVLDAPDTYLETSASAMFLYGMAECRKEKLIEVPYTGTMRSAWAGLAKMVDAGGRVIGVSAGTGPSGKSGYLARNVGTYTWGTGALLLAACAYAETGLHRRENPD